jgi:hypothetical protein
MRKVFQVLGQRPQAAGQDNVHPSARRLPSSILELKAAKEILGEIFDASAEEVEEMLRERLRARLAGLEAGI